MTDIAERLPVQPQVQAGVSEVSDEILQRQEDKVRIK